MSTPYQNPFEEPGPGSQHQQQPSPYQSRYQQQGYQQPNYQQQGYPMQGYPQPGAQQQNQPMPYQQYQPVHSGYQAGATKSKIAAALLAFFLGVFGAHDFYMKRNGRAVGKLSLLVIGTIPLMGWIHTILGIWVIIDFVRILLGHGEMGHDKRGTPLT